MKIFVLAETDIKGVGYNPNTIQLFISRDKALEEMKRMYQQALKARNTTEDDPMNVFDASGYASIGEADYRLDIYECELDIRDYLHEIQEITVAAEDHGVRSKLMSERNMSRPDVWFLMQDWASEFIEKTKDYKWGEDKHYYDEVDFFIERKAKQLDMPELRPDADVEDDIELTDDKLFGVCVVVTAHLHIYDGYAEGDGIRVEFPKLSDLTAAQIEEIDRYVGGRIKDSGFVVPDDVLLKYGKVVSFSGIMDTGQNHDADLVRRINVAWVRCKDEFEPILKALYERDIDEITDSDAFRIPAWEDWPEYHHGCNTNDWTAYNKLALETMKEKWGEYAENYLMHVADDQDLECILDFVRG